MVQHQRLAWGGWREWVAALVLLLDRDSSARLKGEVDALDEIIPRLSRVVLVISCRVIAVDGGVVIALVALALIAPRLLRVQAVGHVEESSANDWRVEATASYRKVRE